MFGRMSAWRIRRESKKHKRVVTADETTSYVVLITFVSISDLRFDGEMVDKIGLSC
jgi:hypothetical protein